MIDHVVRFGCPLLFVKNGEFVLSASGSVADSRAVVSVTGRVGDSELDARVLVEYGSGIGRRVRVIKVLAGEVVGFHIQSCRYAELVNRCGGILMAFDMFVAGIRKVLVVLKSFFDEIPVGVQRGVGVRVTVSRARGEARDHPRVVGFERDRTWYWCGRIRADMMTKAGSRHCPCGFCAMRRVSTESGSAGMGEVAAS